jgi:hypothetical protein
MALAIAAPTMPSTMFMISPRLLFMNCSASQPAILPTMIAVTSPLQLLPSQISPQKRRTMRSITLCPISG